MDREELVDNVTRIIMERLNGGSGGSGGGPVVVTFGDVPASVLGAGVNARAGRTPADVDGAQYIVLTQAAFRTFHGGVVPVAPVGVSVAAPAAASAPACNVCAGGYDLTGKKVVSDKDVRALGLTSGSTVRVGEKAIVTALARDYCNSVGAQIVR